MQKPFVRGVGGVLSADIAVPDHQRELDFYRSILTAGDSPCWRDDLMNNLGEPVIGLGARTPEYDTLPLQWMPHFQVADVAASASSAIELGGQVLMQSKTEDGQSQWAVIVDQLGAAFGVIPVVESESGAHEQNDRRGCISGLSLIVPNALPARDFYQSVVGWSAHPVESEDRSGQVESFEMQTAKGIAAAEIRQDPHVSSAIPSVWLIHLPVDDLMESLRRVSEGGGEVIKQYAEGKYAVIRDPVGVFLVLQAAK